MDVAFYKVGYVSIPKLFLSLNLQIYRGCILSGWISITIHLSIRHKKDIRIALAGTLYGPVNQLLKVWQPLPGDRHKKGIRIALAVTNLTLWYLLD